MAMLKHAAYFSRLGMLWGIKVFELDRSWIHAVDAQIIKGCVNELFYFKLLFIHSYVKENVCVIRRYRGERGQTMLIKRNIISWSFHRSISSKGDINMRAFMIDVLALITDFSKVWLILNTWFISICAHYPTPSDV